MLDLYSRITFDNNIVFDFVNDVEIESSWESITDRARIIVPRKLSFKGRPIVIGAKSIFQRGQTVKIELGYDNVLLSVFDGYISKIDPRLPIVFECEDLMYQLKKNRLPNQSYSSVNLSTLLKNIIPSSVKYSASLDQGLGKFRISNNATTAQVLDYLRGNYSIYSFFRDGVLQIGLPYVPRLRKNHKFYMEKNVIDSSLEYLRADDVVIRVRAVSIDDKNKQVEYFYPTEDTQGETKTISKYNLSLSDLKQEAKRFYDTFKYEGWRGGFTTFGAPFVNHGDGIELQSDMLPEYNEGIYLCKSRRSSFGMGGYRQNIELANRIT